MPVRPLHSSTVTRTSDGVSPLRVTESVTVDSAVGDVGERVISPNVGPAADDTNVAPKTLIITTSNPNFLSIFMIIIISFYPCKSTISSFDARIK